MSTPHEDCPLPPHLTTPEHHSPECACKSIHPLKELPFLHSVANKDAQRNTARLVTFIFCLIYSLSRHLPQCIRGPLYTAIKWLDGLLFLAVHYLEHVLVQASVFLCGRIDQPARRLSATAGTYMRRVSESRFGLVVVRIGEHADEDVAEIVRIVADTCEEFVDRVLPPAYTFVCGSRGGPEKAEECQEKVDVVERDVDEWKLDTNTEVQNRVASGSQVDCIVVGSLEARNGMDSQNEPQEVSNNNSIRDGAAARHENLYNFDDEGYKSADEAPVLEPIRTVDTSPSTVHIPRVRSMLEPFEAADEAEAVHTSEDPYIEIESPKLTSSNPQVLNSQNSWNNKTLLFPSRTTFDDIPGLRRQTQTGIEAKRLVTISMEAASRAHHHWLRPCVACARKAGQEKSESKMEKAVGEERAERKDSKRVGGMYMRTVHWVRKQGRIKQL